MCSPVHSMHTCAHLCTRAQIDNIALNLKLLKLMMGQTKKLGGFHEVPETLPCSSVILSFHLLGYHDIVMSLVSTNNTHHVARF